MRRRWVQDRVSGDLIEVGDNYVAEPREHHRIVGDRHYDGLQTVDGVDISTRQKHRDYMKRTGLTTTDDFKNQWKDAEKKRAAVKEGHDPTRRSAVERAIYQHTEGRRT